MFVVTMGVSGSGKSTLGGKLAAELDWDFLEGDELHPSSNIEKMRAGVALDDDDRWPWLDRIADWMRDESARGRHGVVACSALKRGYRDQLRRESGELGELRFVYLRVARDELERRIGQREHFMPASLLDSQLQILQEPTADEYALTLEGGTSSNHSTMDELVRAGSPLDRLLSRSVPAAGFDRRLPAGKDQALLAVTAATGAWLAAA